MSIINSQPLIGASGSTGYKLQRSVRLRSSASAYFTRTPSTATNKRTFTWSGWVKRGAIDINSDIFGLRIDGNNQFRFFFNSSNQIDVYNQASATIGARLTTTAVYRDLSAWYHIVLAIDTTNATAGDRMRLYVNGVEVTTFGTDTQPSLNYDTYINTVNVHNIGNFPTSTDYFNGYLTEVNFIDGQALTPSSFGSINSTTGVWQPIKYSGTYGTNGFYLNFNDNSAATAAAIGKDSSGNGNNWTPNNISVTAGVTYDSMLDVPTLTSSDNSNFCTGNPLDNSTTLSNANLTVSATANTGVTGTIALPSSGSFYWETTVTTVAPSGNTIVGILAANQAAGVRNVTAGGIRAYARSDGLIIVDSTTVQSGLTAFSNGDVIGGAYNTTTNSIQFYRNGSTYGTAVTPTTGYTYVPWCASAGTSVFNWNFGQRPFTYTPPSGFKSLNTYNLPAPTIPNGATQFAATTYTGTGSSLAISNTVNGKLFQPDLVWVKGRSGATDHALYDSVRGTTKQLESNTTTAETTEATGLTAFDTGGFTVGALAQMNTNTATYVGWQWKASNAAPVTNTLGSITSSVSANPSAGFSIVTYTGTGANATVGHGLGIAPKMLIIKNRASAVENWWVWHTSLPTPTNSRILLNTTAAYDPGASSYWNGAIPTSTVFSLGTAGGNNGSGNSHVAYCFSEIAGYSKFGSYTGNGSADGPFVYLGFRPRFILAKRTDTVSDWWLYDTSRNTYNVISTPLFADLSNAEGNNAVYNLDLLSNGFKWRTADTTMNGSGGTYIYAAFAESPFNYSLAR